MSNRFRCYLPDDVTATLESLSMFEKNEIIIAMVRLMFPTYMSRAELDSRIVAMMQKRLVMSEVPRKAV